MDTGLLIIDWVLFLVGIVLIAINKKISHKGGRIAAIVAGIACIVVSTIIMFTNW